MQKKPPGSMLERYNPPAWTGLLIAVLMAAAVFSCGPTRKERWDSSSPAERMAGRPSDHPPGHGWNTDE